MKIRAPASRLMGRLGSREGGLQNAGFQAGAAQPLQGTALASCRDRQASHSSRAGPVPSLPEFSSQRIPKGSVGDRGQDPCCGISLHGAPRRSTGASSASASSVHTGPGSGLSLRGLGSRAGADPQRASQEGAWHRARTPCPGSQQGAGSRGGAHWSVRCRSAPGASLPVG